MTTGLLALGMTLSSSACRQCGKRSKTFVCFLGVAEKIIYANTTQRLNDKTLKIWVLLNEMTTNHMRQMAV